MVVRHAQTRVDSRPLGAFEGIGRHVDVLRYRPCQPADGRLLDRFAYLLHRMKITRGRDGESGLDHIHAERLELTRDLDLLLHVKGSSRRLFAVTKGRIEYVD